MTIAARRSMSLCYLTSLALALMTTASLAQTPTKSLKDQLIGHWQLTAVMVHGRTAYGTNPQGSMFFDSNGHFAVIVISNGEAKDISYFGTYAVDEANKSLAMHVDASTGGAADGRDVKRLVTFNGDQLILVNQMSTGVPGGIKLTWKQSN